MNTPSLASSYQEGTGLVSRLSQEGEYLAAAATLAMFRKIHKTSRIFKHIFEHVKCLKFYMKLCNGIRFSGNMCVDFGDQIIRTTSETYT